MNYTDIVFDPEWVFMTALYCIHECFTGVLCCDNSHGLKKHLRWNLISKINEKQVFMNKKQVILISTKLKPEAQLSVETMQKTEII